MLQTAHGDSFPPSPQSQEQTAQDSANGALANGEAKAKRGNGADLLPVRTSLPYNLKAAIVEKLACFEPLSEIRKWLASEHNLRLDERTLGTYNPVNRHCRLGKRLRDHYATTRKLYTEKAADVAIAHQAHRLRKLEEIATKALTAKDFNAALKAMELAAKEMGQLTQTVRHEGTVSHVHGTVEDARAEVAMRLQQLSEAMALPAPTVATEEGEYVDVEAVHPAPPPPAAP